MSSNHKENYTWIHEIMQSSTNCEKGGLILHQLYMSDCKYAALIQSYPIEQECIPNGVIQCTYRSWGSQMTCTYLKLDVHGYLHLCKTECTSTHSTAQIFLKAIYGISRPKTRNQFKNYYSGLLMDWNYCTWVTATMQHLCTTTMFKTRVHCK